ncbi:hypothetical protein CRUP_037680 [Coryphaenoides rupestris]|nr:hypothetical protein CRUP_037680 [Coryphaenoides rupestris]
MVAVLCSEDAEKVTRRNNLNFAELLRPFCRLTSEGHIRDPNNQMQPVKNLRISVNNVCTRPTPATGSLSPAQRRLLSEVVSSCQPPEGGAANIITAGDYDLSFHGLLVVSSSEAVPVEQFLKLSQEQHRIQHSGDYTHPRWFIPNTLKYYVLLHDTSQGDEQRADTVYEDMKQRYGSQGCYLLKINSRTAPTGANEQIPDPWSQYLHKNTMLNQESYEEPPHAEANSVVAENNVHSNDLNSQDSSEKDDTPDDMQGHPLQLECPPSEAGRLDTLGVTTSGAPPAVRAAVAATAAGTHGDCLTLNDHDHIRQFLQEFTFRGLLPHIEKNIRQLNDQAPELQIRKMADLCFLVQHYELAYSCYHTAKKDFLSDQAMLYAAGALEMAAVSAFLQAGATRPYPAHYMDTAIQTYRDSCKNMVLAERCALLSTEDSDLRSALLLEQAAHCFINMRNPMVRKFAFHMILAGHRFSKAGQDHINFTIGRQSFTLRQPDHAAEAFRHILTNDSQQTAVQQGSILRDVSAESEKQAATHVSLDQEYDHEQAVMWCQLEEQAVASANRGVVPAAFQPTQCCLNSQTDNLRPPLAVVEEPIIVEVTFQNPLKVSLLLSELSLLWSFTPKDLLSAPQNGDLSAAAATGEPVTNHKADNKDDVITTEIIPVFNFGPKETKVARLKLLPHMIGQQSTKPLVVRGQQDLEIRGPRLNHTKEDKTSVSHGQDQRLHPIITPPMPLLEVFFLQFPTALLCGEITKAYVEFCNVSGVALRGLRVASTHPPFFTFGSGISSSSSSPATPPTPLSPASAEVCSAYQTLATPPGDPHHHLHPGAPPPPPTYALASPGEGSVRGRGVAMEIPVEGGVLRPGQSAQLPLWLRGPDREGVHEINFLFYYESAEKGGRIRHNVFICASRSLSVCATACQSSVPPPADHRAGEEDGDHLNDGMLVFVDVENVNMSEAGVREFHIIQVSSCSRQWRLHKCINPAKDKATSTIEEKYTFADLNLGNDRIVSSTTPCADFFFRCCPGAVSREGRGGALSHHSSSRPPAGHWSWGGGPSEVASLVRKCNELDLNVIVLWKAYVVEDNKQLILEGQLHVTLQTVGKEACSLPQKEPSVEQLPDSLEVHGSFTWLGQTQYRRRLRPQEVTRLPLRACFLHAGVYNLSTPRVFAKFTAPAKEGEKVVWDGGVGVETSQQAASPALIIITSQA